MKKTILATFLFSLFSLSSGEVENKELLKKENNIISYEIKKEDTLWDLSEKFLGSPFLWKHIEKNNNIKYDNLEVGKNIFIDMTWVSLKKHNIPYKKNINKEIDVSKIEHTGYSKYLMNNILYDTIIIDKESINKEILASERKQNNIGILDNFYVNKKDVNLNEVYKIYKQKKEIKSHEVLEYTEVGEAIVVDFIDDLALLQTIKARADINKGDIILKKKKDYNNFLKHVKETKLEEKTSIISITDNKKEAGLFDYIVIDNKNNNLKEGYILSIYSKSEKVLDKITNKENLMPPEKKAKVIIVKVDRQFSIGIISKSYKNITKDDYIK